MKMFEALRILPVEVCNRVKEDDVVRQLSFNTWKTCNRILEEIGADRVVNGREPPIPFERGFWLSPKMSTRSVLTRLLIKQVVEIKFKDTLSSSEAAWASMSDSNADQKEYDTRNGQLAFYRLKTSGGTRKYVEDRLPEGAPEPVIVR
ncbi:MAG: hypothetical protein UT33_C0007G0066 [Candidatus Peregrinibacteria bacterium GW2011_GWC2_39_14]|nr:MAG: hypothetical protein US92_C0002G0067 [Candidatus Peregrinibacteria bacterium GW2011_GWA2_38_36]KKR06878.1 MAG: hypothetical protein UT33_C0007G0066 [Candidatus Peregrinibacteria bacterium GW2011_GWC2_39_14]